MKKKFLGAKGKPSPFNGKYAPDPVDTDRQPPVFSFEYMVNGNGYSVECCTADHRAALTSRLFTLSRMTWTQIRGSHRHGLGSEKIARNSIRPAIPARITDDVEFLAIRYNGLCPMVGFRDGRTFNIVFLDHTMNCYPH